MKRRSQIPIYWVMATLCIALIPQLATMPPQLILLSLLPVAWRLAAEIRGWKPTHMIIRVLATAITVFVLITAYGGLWGRRAAVSMLAIMLTLKLLETFKVRDARVVASFSLFLCAMQFLFLQTIPMLIYGVSCVVAAMIALALLNRQQSFEPVGTAPEAATGMLSELKFSMRLLGMALPFGLALFFLFPRWGSPLWGVPEETLDSKTGLSDSMTPGSIQSLFMDDSPAFRAQFQTGTPTQIDLYWRGPVFWNFDGSTWRGSFYGRNVPAEDRPEIRSAPWRYTVQLEPNERNWLFALDYPAVVPSGVTLTMDYQLYANKPVTQLRDYLMLSNPGFVDSPRLKSTIRAMALDLPEDFNPQTREMMQRWREETPEDGELILRTLSYFRSEEFHYTLNPPLLTEHTVDEFLFDTREGFCEHYASAFTVMMRMAGIPARVVTGYQGGWFNDLGRYILVRQSDAHAWTEVWLERSGWTRVDPTAAVAPNRIEQSALDALGNRRYALDFAWVRNVRNGIDVLQRLWNDGVIAFDATRQLDLLERFGLKHLGSQGLVLVLSLVIAALVLLLTPVILRLRVRGRQDAAGRLWARFRNQLAAAGVETLHSQGPLEIAEAACSKLRQRQREIRSFTDLYLRMRYAQNPPDYRELDRALRQFSAAT